MKHAQLVLTGELEFRTAHLAKAVENKEDGWYAINIIAEDGHNQSKLILPLSLDASIKLYNSMRLEIMKLHKKIYDHGDGEYQFDPELLESIINQGERSQ